MLPPMSRTRSEWTYQILAMHATNRAIEIPILLFFLELLQFLLAFCHLCDSVPFGYAAFVGVISLALCLELAQLFLVQDAFDLAIPEALLACQHARFARLANVSKSLG